MTDTLTYVDSIQRIGYTTFDGVKVVQHTCTIDSENPQKMRVAMIKMDAEMYKANREICRDDFAVFEDAAYALQEELIAKSVENTENTESM